MPQKKQPAGEAPAITRASTTYSKARYAHPFFLPVPSPLREPINGHSRMTDWIQQNLGPIPPVVRGGNMDLSEVIGPQGVKEIEDLGEIRFHAMGDTGQDSAFNARQIADEMATDFKPTAGGLNPAFLLHLGDVIYGNDKGNHYGERFYSPFKHYPGKILAIPGNHDGEVPSPLDSPSLKDFRANFCAGAAAVPPQAAGSGIYRETMTQPGVYWFLDAPFVQIIGLYSNCAENPGFLAGITDGKPDFSQALWLARTLVGIAGRKQKKALIMATHHPPYSQSGHSGSPELNKSIFDICAKTGVFPDLFLSGHTHNYQRFTRRIAGKQIPYIVAGTGGVDRVPVFPATGQPVDSSRDVTYDAAVASFGYLFLAVSAKKLAVQFWEFGSQHTKPFDAFIIDWTTHVLIDMN